MQTRTCALRIDCLQVFFAVEFASLRPRTPVHESTFARSSVSTMRSFDSDDLVGKMPRDGACARRGIGTACCGRRCRFLRHRREERRASKILSRQEQPWRRGIGAKPVRPFGNFFLPMKYARIILHFGQYAAETGLARKAGDCFGFSPSFSEWFFVLADRGRF
jgi:hypothetical protein